jgi:hypothetical protein
MTIAFTTTITDRDWDSELGGWRCPALKIPGAMVDAVFVAGARVDPSWYEVLREHSFIRWVRPDHPQQAIVSLKLTQELSTRELTVRWKKLAIVLPLLSSVFVALIAGSFSYYSQRNKGASVPPPSETKSPQPQPSQQQSKDAPTFDILMPRGLRVLVIWKDMPDDGEKALRDMGVALGKVDEATKIAYAALAKRSPDEIEYYPFITSEGKPFPGYAFAVTKPGPAANAGYGEFQLFQQEQFFKIYFHKTQDGEANGPPIPTNQLGVDWSRVRQGLSTALEELYLRKKYVEFGHLELVTKPNGEWEYHLNYKLFDRK